MVSLFGPTFIAWTRTYFGKEIHLQKAVPCGPCQLRVCPTDHACMTSLTPQEVLGGGSTSLLAAPTFAGHERRPDMAWVTILPSYETALRRHASTSLQAFLDWAGILVNRHRTGRSNA